MQRYLFVLENPRPPLVYRLEDPCRLRIGRRQDCDISLHNGAVSRQHCLLEVHDGKAWINDTNSRNGTWMEHVRVTGRTELPLETTVRLAGAYLALRDHPGINPECYQSSSLEQLLSYLPGRGSNRKLRLLACAWHRERFGPLNSNCRLVTAAEAFADGVISTEQLEQERTAFQQGETDQTEVDDPWKLATTSVACPSAGEALAGLLRCLYVYTAIGRVDGVFRDLAVDVLGDFFAPFQAEDAWLRWHEGLIPSMARMIYDTRDFASMPVLADALEDAGCTWEHVLKHCRSGQPHARGCWVLDGLLERREMQVVPATPGITVVG